MTLAAQLYSDALDEVNAKQPTLVRLDTLAVSGAGATALAGDANELLLAFWANVQIGELSQREANWLFTDWRDATTSGIPYNFVREGFSQKQLQLVPHVAAGGSAQALVSYSPQAAVPNYLQMPIALLILSEEYLRESPHQNVPLSGAFRALAELLLGALWR